MPVTSEMSVDLVVQVCQPPVLETLMLPTGSLVRESMRTSILPLTPLPAPDATRALNWVAALSPNTTFGYSAQSPGDM